jgi:hypothetical protein
LGDGLPGVAAPALPLAEPYRRANILDPVGVRQSAAPGVEIKGNGKLTGRKIDFTTRESGAEAHALHTLARGRAARSSGNYGAGPEAGVPAPVSVLIGSYSQAGLGQAMSKARC